MTCAAPHCRHQTRRKNRLCSRCMMRAWRAANPMKAAYAHLKHNAKRRGKEFSLTSEQFAEWWKLNMLAMFPRGQNGDAISVDRIDQSRGYSLDNIQALTVSENSRKWHHRDKMKAENATPF